MVSPSLCTLSLQTIQLMILGDLFEKSWKMVVSPLKVPHRLSVLGPKEQTIDGKLVKRIDLTIPNDQGVNISAMLFYSPEIPNPDLVLYLHGNGGSKTEALDLVKCVTKFGFGVAAFDFVGCGNSGDGYLTYGIQEMADVRRVLYEIKKHLSYRKLTLWGRSMGAAISILFAANYPNEVSSLVLDVPFCTLDGIVKRAAYRQSTLPKSVIDIFLYFVKRKCEEETGQKIFSIDYLTQLKRLHRGLSILFLYSKVDRIVSGEEVLQFYHIFQGKKEICELYEDHQQDRKESTFIEGIKWIKRFNGTPDKIKRLDMLIREGDIEVQKGTCNC